jgi:5'-3' exonuclease
MEYKINLIIDGNYVLNKNIFPLHQSNVLYGYLREVLDKQILEYARLYHFNNIYLVSDSKGSWRKGIFGDYKGNRNKSQDMDWEFIYQTYTDFKSDLPKNITVLESDSIEGDDWIWGVVKKSNKMGYSNLIISNDYDMKQLLETNLSGESWVNLMSNEKYTGELCFLPQNYQSFMNKLKHESDSDDLFSMSENGELYKFFKKYIENKETVVVDKDKELILKLITGDKSDNIPSCFQKPMKNGKMRGIGDKGGQNIYDKYLEEFGKPDIEDPDLLENIADIVCENKKLTTEHIPGIVEKLEFNGKLIDLNQIPNDIQTLVLDTIIVK